MQANYIFEEGHVPLLISMPHSGVFIPADIQAQLTPIAKERADTDWHLPLLYNMTKALGVSTIKAQYSRYVIDLNRSREDDNLYPGQDTTGLFPIDTFDKKPLYLNNVLPTKEEKQRRIALYWEPYHQQIQTQLERMRAQYGVAILWDAHSIASQVPRFFEGKLPDLNFGTANQTSCALSLENALENTLCKVLHDSMQLSQVSHVFNGRFKGGYITRHYGKPEDHIHAVQLEMSQCLYMNEQSPYTYRPELAEKIQPILTRLLQTCIDWANKNQQKAFS